MWRNDSLKPDFNLRILEKIQLDCEFRLEIDQPIGIALVIYNRKSHCILVLSELEIAKYTLKLKHNKNHRNGRFIFIKH